MIKSQEDGLEPQKGLNAKKLQIELGVDHQYKKMQTTSVEKVPEGNEYKKMY